MASASNRGGREGPAGRFKPSIMLWVFLLALALIFQVFVIRSGTSLLKITGKAPQPGSEAKLLWLCFLVALVAVVLAGLIHELTPSNQRGLLKPVYGLPTWDPTGSWASNLTAAGAILGIILAQNVIPTTTTYFTKEQYVLLSFLFGGLIILGPFLYNCFTATVPDPSTNEPTRCGYGITFLLATLLTTWAVCGQLVLSWFLVAEFTSAKDTPMDTINVLHVALATAVPLLVFYVVSTVPGVMEAQHLPKPKALYLVPGKEPALVAAPARRWALL